MYGGLQVNGGMWDISVAGHISTGQDAFSAASREISDELNSMIENKEVVERDAVYKELISYLFRV